MTHETRLNRYFKDYATYHQTSGNQLCHYLGIPLIVITALGLLSRWVFVPELFGVPWLQLDGGILLLVIAAVWYGRTSFRLGAPFSLFSLGLYFLGRAIPIPALWAGFVLGWVFQFVGHYRYEKKSPAFLKNLEHLLVGPLWVFAKLTGYREH